MMRRLCQSVAVKPSKCCSHLNLPYRTLTFETQLYILVGRDRVVSVATRYGLGGSGIESRRGRDFPHSSESAQGPTQTPVQWVPGLFPGGKAAGAWS
jgi:hypothetical protein